jgi:hypothetical protein
LKELKLLNSDKPVHLDDDDYYRLSKIGWNLYYIGNIGHKVIIIVGAIDPLKNTRIANFVMGSDAPYVHKDGDPFNNQKHNLIPRKKHKNSTSKYVGVSWNKHHKKWLATISKNKKRYDLGYFNDEKEAAIAYNFKAIELFGAHILLNDVRDI